MANPKKKKITIILRLFVFLVFAAGIILVSYPTLSNWWNELHASRAIAGYAQAVESLTEDNTEEMLVAATAYNKQLVGKADRYNMTDEDRELYNSLLDASGTGIMSYIEIPKIDVRLPVYHGADEAILQIAVGHIEGSSLPVGGTGTHCVMSGHTGLPSAKLFTKLDKLESGDTFYLHTLRKTFAYTVDQVEIVLPDDFSLLDIDPEQDYVTLITCTPYGINSHRLLVRGVRTPELEVEDSSEESNNAPTASTQVEEGHDLPMEQILVGAAIIFCLLFILTVFFRGRSSKKD